MIALVNEDALVPKLEKMSVVVCWSVVFDNGEEVRKAGAGHQTARGPSYKNVSDRGVGTLWATHSRITS